MFLEMLAMPTKYHVRRQLTCLVDNGQATVKQFWICGKRAKIESPTSAKSSIPSSECRSTDALSG